MSGTDRVCKKQISFPVVQIGLSGRADRVFGRADRVSGRADRVFRWGRQGFR